VIGAPLDQGRDLVERSLVVVKVATTLLECKQVLTIKKTKKNCYGDEFEEIQRNR